jgi:endonuclease G, mitochondrial
MKKKRKNNWLFLLLALIFIGAFLFDYFKPTDKPIEIQSQKEITYKTSPNKKESKLNNFILYAGKPISKNYPNKIKILENKGFMVGYDEKRKNPAWAAYRVFSCEYKCNIGLKRSPKFFVDTRTTAEVKPSDYSKSNYDRGHLAPNHAIATRYGRDAQYETFFMSNIVPQKANLNREVWADMEKEIADQYADELDEVWVIVGPIYDDNVRDRFLTKNKIEIPDRFFAVVLDELNNKPRTMAYIMPQKPPHNSLPRDFIVSVDEVEKQSGLDFFTELNDQIEEKAESQINDFSQPTIKSLTESFKSASKF